MGQEARVMRTTRAMRMAMAVTVITATMTRKMRANMMALEIARYMRILMESSLSWSMTRRRPRLP